MFLIYCLIDPTNFEIRYVGKSTSGLKRPNEKHTHYCGNWINFLKNKKLKPIVKIIQVFNDKKYLNEAEKYWIKYFRDLKCPLTNIASGGQGSSLSGSLHPNFGKPLKESTKKLLSKKLSGKNNPFYGKIHSKQFKDKYFNGKSNHMYQKFGLLSPVSKPILCIDDNKYFESITSAAKYYSIDISNLRKHLKGKNKRFKFINREEIQK